jgi:hypothetical protein
MGHNNVTFWDRRSDIGSSQDELWDKMWSLFEILEGDINILEGDHMEDFEMITRSSKR